MHVFKVTVKLYHTDAARRLFYAKQFEFAYDCYQDFLAPTPYAIGKMIYAPDGLMTPVISCSADFRRPLYVGDELTVSMNLKELRAASFALGYKILNRRGEHVGDVQTVHVTLAADGTRVEVPEGLRALLTGLQNET